MPQQDRSTITIAKGTTYAIAGAVIGKGSEYATKIILGRSLGPEDFGVFSLVYGGLLFLGSLSILDLTAPVLRFSSTYFVKGEWAKIKKLFLSTVAFSQVVGIALIAITLIFSDRISEVFTGTEAIEKYILYILIGLPFFVFDQYAFTLLIALKKYKTLVMLREVLNKTLRLLLIIGFMTMLQLSLEGILAIYVTIFVLISVWAIFSLRGALGKNELEPNGEGGYQTAVYREVWGFSWPLILSAILSATMARLDIFSVGYFLSMTDVGLYSAAYTLGLLIYFPAKYFNEMLVPTASQLFLKKDMVRLSTVYKTNTTWIFYVMFPFVIFFFLRQT